MNELQRSSGMPLTVSLGLVQKIGQGRYGRGVRTLGLALLRGDT